MTYFSNLMDDIKTALILSHKNKGLFLPAIIANVLVIVAGIAAFVYVMVAIIGSISTFESNNYDLSFFLVLGTTLLIFILIFSLLFMIIDIGITGLVIGVVDGEKASSKLFFATVKNHLLSVFLTNIGYMFIYLIALILLAIPLVLYLLTVGLLTGGWGMIFLTCSIQSLLSYWVLIKIEDHRGGFESIGANIKFGRQNFWLMVLIMYIQFTMSSFLPSLLGLLGAAIAAFFISYVIITVMKIVILQSYRRYRVDTRNGLEID